LKAYNEARVEMGKILKGADADDTSGGDALAGELENLEVKEADKGKAAVAVHLCKKNAPG
jgi:hypothetical protein